MTPGPVDVAQIIYIEVLGSLSSDVYICLNDATYSRVRNDSAGAIEVSMNIDVGYIVDSIGLKESR